MGEATMRILITGAAGFLGSHLCDRFLAEGHEVIGMDNFITGDPNNLAHLAGEKRFTFYERDVSEYIFIQNPSMPFCISPHPPVPTRHPPMDTRTCRSKR